MSSEIDVLKFTSDELTIEKLNELIKNKRSFQIVAVKDISFSVKKIEGEIEKNGFSCRVYTEFRSAAIAAAAVPVPFVTAVGLATAIGVGIHNLATFNPDYEIAKNEPKSLITVNYKKE